MLHGCLLHIKLPSFFFFFALYDLLYALDHFFNIFIFLPFFFFFIYFLVPFSPFRLHGFEAQIT